ncbi:MAG TPA: TerC family protein [Abditibacterium sp.]|jgi:predicted tellurium resistance membrane protein TerC
MDFSWMSQPSSWIAFGTLAALEIVLGIDNIIFISILSGKLPEAQRAKARTIGLALAMITRILLLLSLAWIMKLTDPLFTIPFLSQTAAPVAHGAHEVANIPGQISGRDLILILGGLFLLYKSVHEIHGKLEGEHGSAETSGKPVSFNSIIAQILVLDIVFSLDSVITAVGMVSNISIMISAVVLAVGVMLFAAGPISTFVEKHPTVKMLALSFLLLIGVTLLAEGFGQHISKGYIYFAMAFAVMVEMLNLRLRKGHSSPVELREPYAHK